MAQTNYSKNFVREERREGVISRQEYSLRAGEFCARGQDLPHAKLIDLDVIAIRSAAKQRDSLRKYISENLSNAALASKFSVHERNIEKILTRQTWSHI